VGARFAELLEHRDVSIAVNEAKNAGAYRAFELTHKFRRVEGSFQA
jgi:hypothetical protein